MLIITAAGCLSIIASEWWRWYASVPPNPVLMTIFFGLLFFYCILRLLPLRQRIKALKMARDGEKAVGQYLEHLRADGHHVFHDVVGENFNIDHVVIGEKGIFTIETKTYSKPVRGPAKIHFDGEFIAVNGHKLDRNPVVQSLAQAGWLSAQIQESTGHAHSIQPVVVFPGWFVTAQADAARRSGVWVLNPKVLPKFVDNAPQTLVAEEAKLVAYHLSRYIRTCSL